MKISGEGASAEREKLQIITTGHNHTEPPSKISVDIVKSCGFQTELIPNRVNCVEAG